MNTKTKVKVNILSVLLTIILFCCGCNYTRITKENYNKIHNGMSFNEVVNILGDNYEVSSDASFGGYTSSCYIWESLGYCITIIFVNDKVYSKAQAG